MATVRNDDQRDDPDPPHSSACLSRDVSMGIHAWPIHYLGIHPIGMVGYRPTQ
jgi:hypothetical protein